jgi:acyl-CoA dehydrogenase
MDFSPPASVAPILARVRAFVDDELIPLEPKLAQGFAAIEPLLEQKRAQAKAAGLWCPQMPKDLGGMGLSLLEHAFVSEELGRSPVGHYALNCQAPDAGNMEVLHSHGTDAQKERFLRPLVEGKVRSCFSMTEPDRPGSNPTWMATVAKKDGADYVIDGKKWFTSSADGAAFAIVMAVTDEGADAYARASQILVPTSTPGFRFVRNIPIMGDVGHGWASHAEIDYVSCRVPRENLLGGEGQGFVIAQERLGPGRIHHCMRWLGICARAFDMTCARAASRELAPGKPLGMKQSMQHAIAESRMAIHAARLMVLHAAWKIDAEGAYAAREEISLIKVFVARTLQTVLDRAIQAHGALGMTDETPLSFWYRHERAARIYDGPDEVHLSVVAKRLLKQHGLQVPA